MSADQINAIKAELIRRELERRKNNSPEIPKSTSRMSGVVGGVANILSGNAKEEAQAVGQETLNNVVGAVEGFTGGFVNDENMSSLTGIDLPDGSNVGKIMGFIAGPGKIANLAGKGVKSLFGKGAKEAGTRIAKATSKGFVGNSFKSGVKTGMATTATEGAVGGFLFPQEELDFKNRFMAGVVGGLIGAPIGAVFGGAKGFLEAKKVTRSAKKVKDYISKIRSRPEGQGVSDGPIFSGTDYVKTASKNIDDIKNARTSKIDALRSKGQENIDSIKSSYNDDLINLESAKAELEQLFINDSDEAIKAIKEVGPKWVNSKYQWYGNTLDDIANDMSKRKVSIKVSNLSDELNEILKNRRVGLQEPYGASRMTSSEAAVNKWVTKLNKFRSKYANDAVDPIYDQDANMMLSDVVDELAKIRKIGDKRMSRELDRALGNILEKSGDSVSAQRLADLNKEYAKFTPLRDLIENSFEPVTENVVKGRKVLGEVAKQSKGLVDRNLNVDQIRQLQKLEKELGIPFLKKLQSYGDDMELLKEQETALKKMLAEKISQSRSMTSDVMRGVRVDAQQALKSQQDKLARTNAVMEALETRVNEQLDLNLKAVKVPETVASQMKTAALAYLLARVLGKTISTER